MKRFLTFLTALFIASPLIAAQPIMMGTGGPTGNYFGMAEDINSYCSSVIDRPLDIINTSGSIENLLGMSNKKFSIGWVQEDVLQFYSKQTPTKVNRNRMKVIIGGHNESLHILLPKNYQPTSADEGWFSSVASKLSFTEKPIQGLDLNLLKGQKVGSWGGSLVSAKALSLFADLQLDIVEISEEQRGKPGKIPILLVGGQPYAPVEKYLATGKYNLIPIDAATITTKAPFYVAQNISYSIGGKIQTLPSVGVRALLVGKSFRKEERNENMAALATCISGNLEDLADDPDTNPNWSAVFDLESTGAQTNWSYFRLQ